MLTEVLHHILLPEPPLDGMEKKCMFRCVREHSYKEIPIPMQNIPQIPLQPVDAVTISIFADNLFDGLLPDQGPAKRPMLGPGVPRVSAPLMEGKDTFAPILAQHGFSALVTLTQHGREHQVLFDTGVTPDGLIQNMQVFDRSPKDIETVVKSVSKIVN